MSKESRMKMSELVKISGVPRTAIHFYLREGLLDPPDKTGATMAYYNETHLRRLEAIQKIKLEFLKDRKSARIPLDFIKHQLQEAYTLAKPRGLKGAVGKKRTEDQKSQRKVAIIEAALKLYANRGFYLTSVRDIAKAAGISPPTFYLYFPDKRELFVEVIEYVIGAFNREIQAALQTETNMVKRTIILFQKFYENYSKIGEILNQLRAGVIVKDSWAKERLAKVYEKLTGFLATEIKANMELGLVRRMNPDLLAYFIVTIAEAEIHRASFDDQYSLEQIVLFAADLQYNGFLTNPGRKLLGIDPKYDE